MNKALSIPEIIYHIGWFLLLWDTDHICDYDYPKWHFCYTEHLVAQHSSLPCLVNVTDTSPVDGPQRRRYDAMGHLEISLLTHKAPSCRFLRMPTWASLGDFRPNILQRHGSFNSRSIHPTRTLLASWSTNLHSGVGECHNVASFSGL